MTNLKSDLSGLSAEQILRKDFKALRLGKTVCGISAVPLSLDAWMNRFNDKPAVIRSYARGRELDLFLVMLFQRKPRFKRQLMAYSEDPALLERTIAALTDHGIQLNPVSCGAAAAPPAGRLRCFDQADPLISRKIIIKTLHASLL